MKFEVGDKVICINGHTNGPTQGKIYTVRELRLDADDIWLEGIRMSWNVRRFELVESAPLNSQYLELFQ